MTDHTVTLQNRECSRVAYILETATMPVPEPAIWRALSAAECEAITLYAEGVCEARRARARYQHDRLPGIVERCEMQRARLRETRAARRAMIRVNIAANDRPDILHGAELLRVAIEETRL